jgi:3-phosphoshikimate 1-carboxyvinyltransferase
MGNSGTSARLLMGLAATHPITATFVGDASLSRRPMNRVIAPLSRLGAEFAASPGGGCRSPCAASIPPRRCSTA